MADYGSAGGVGALVPIFSGTNQDFADADRPNSTQVGNFLDQISGMVNAVLAQEGFATPITSPTSVKNALDNFVNQEVADIVAGINGSGRFGPGSKAIEKRGRMAMIVEDVRSFIQGNAVGFERLGADRDQQQADSIGYRSTDESGDDVAPIFQREGFGNTFADWDD